MDSDQIRPLPKPKRLVDLKFMFSSPSIHTNRATFTSARKNRSKHVTQSFFTSQKINKRITTQYRIPNSVKKAINFSVVSQNDICNAKCDRKYLHVATEKKLNGQITNITELKSKSCIKQEWFSENKKNLQSNILRNENLNKSVVTVNSNDVHNVNLVSDTLSEEIINDHKKMTEVLHKIKLQNTKTVNPEFKKLTEENLHLTSNIIKLTFNMLQNNLTLLSALGDSVSVDKSSIDNIGTNSINTSVKPLPSSTVKKSQVMYASMKSHMDILKTPKHVDNSVNTPNTKSRLIVSKNIKRQLEMIYDS